VRPGPGVRQPTQARDRQSARSVADTPQAEPLVTLNEDQRRLIDILQAQQHGMTARQLESQLSELRGQVDTLLEGLLERELVARLNTVIPSYVFRYGGVALKSQ
jgi:hypothetical protein